MNDKNKALYLPLRLASLLCVVLFALFVASCGGKTQTADEAAANDSTAQARVEQAPSNPCSKAFLEHEIREWTRTRDHVLYYSDSFMHLQDSVEELSIDLRGKPYFEGDTWYNSTRYDEDGRDTLLEITRYSDTTAQARIQCIQFGRQRNKLVELRFDPNQEHWYIEDFRIGPNKSLRRRCLEGIHTLGEQLKAREEAEARRQAEALEEYYEQEEE